MIINLLADFPALLLPPSGDLSYHLALAFLPSPNIYPQIDLKQSSSVTFKCLQHNPAWTHVYTHRLQTGAFIWLLFFYVQCWKEKVNI